MVFEPIRTERLVLRAPLLADADAIVEYRSLPEVARYQDWPMPYDRAEGRRKIARAAAMEGPAEGTGWTIVVADTQQPERVLGDLYVELRWGGRSGYIGFSFHPDNWGRGYATEAAEALVAYLFATSGVSRVESSLHPDNFASARVLEACGMLFEGRTIQSFWVGDECSDDLLYGMTRSDWETWRDRPRNRPDRVELVAITEENKQRVLELATHKSQERFVTTMCGSFRDALIPDRENGVPVVPWFRAIEADGEVVGFLMATEMTDAHPNPYLWRLLIDRMHQRRGIGTAALDQFEERCRALGAQAIDISWAEGPGSPAPMYRARGYERTGEVEDGEIFALKHLA